MGLTVLDAGVLIGFLDANDAHHRTAHEELTAARARGDTIAIPASALAESLVGPSRKGAGAVETVEAFLHRLPVQVAALDHAIAVEAAGLCARHGGRLKLPDALVVATAHVLDADVLVTTDRDWPSPAALGLTAALVVL
jgi:predicted nucleic acid-binding protein